MLSNITSGFDANCTAAGADNIRVLYIEDNPSNILLVQKILARRPTLSLEVARTALLGIEMALSDKPSLILLDLNLPGMHGFQVLECIREDPATRTIPVIALTADAMPAQIEKGLAAGFDRYITKPIDITEFLTVIDEYLPPRVTSDH